MAKYEISEKLAIEALAVLDRLDLFSCNKVKEQKDKNLRADFSYIACEVASLKQHILYHLDQNKDSYAETPTRNSQG